MAGHALGVVVRSVIDKVMPVPRILWEPILVLMPAASDASSDHLVHIRLAHAVIGEFAVAAVDGAEEGRVLLLRDAGRFEVCIEHK